MKTVIIDLETSGLVPKGATYELDFLKFPRILSIAWKLNNEETKEFLINQEGFKIPAEATKINGITQEMCDASPYKLADVLSVLILDGVSTDLIIGFNLYFDTSIIKASILRLIQEGIADQITYDAFTDFLHKDKRIDLMRICHKLYGGKWPTMSEAYFKLFGEKFNAHSAGSDVDACHRIYVELEKRGLIPVKVMGVEL